MGAESSSIQIDELLEHASWLSALARRLVTDFAAAEDLVQETWLAALRNPPDDRRNLRGWLGRVATNAARQRHRSAASTVRALAAPDGPPSGESDASPEELVAAMETQRLLAEQVLALPEPYRQTVILRYWHGLDGVEIARREKLAPGTVRWRLKEALDRLRIRLDDRHDGDRRAWCLALLPLARRGVPGGAAVPLGMATALPLLLQGILGMHLAYKLAFLATLVALTLFALERRTASERSVAPAAVALAPAAPASPRADEAGTSPAGLADPARSVPTPIVEIEPAQPASDLAVVEPTGIQVELRVVDRAGNPVSTARLAHFTRAPIETQSIDAGGRLIATVEPPSGMAMEMGKSLRQQKFNFVLSAPGFATELLEGVPPEEGGLHLGEVALAPGGDLSGRVVDEHGVPVARAWVDHDEDRLLEHQAGEARLQRAGGGHWRAQRADSDGRFLLEGVPAGTLRVWAGREGLAAGVTDELELGAGGLIEGLELVLEPFPPDRIISGRVVGDDGEPVAFAVVRFAYRHGFTNYSHVASTEEDGGFVAFCERPESERTLSVSDPQRRWTAARLEGVVPGTTDLLVRLGPTIPLVIEVRGPHGLASSPQLELIDRDGVHQGGAGKRFASADEVAEGIWRTVSPGRVFSIVASAPGLERRTFGPFSPAALPPVVVCELAEAPVVTGRVLIGGEPVDQAEIQIVEEAAYLMVKAGFPVRVRTQPTATATSAATGRFEATVYEGGQYYVHAIVDGHALGEVGPVQIEPAAGLDVGAIALTHGGSIEVRVHVPGGDPSGRIVGVSRGDGRARTARVGPDGTYLFEHLTPGPWQVELRDTEIDPAGSSVYSQRQTPAGPIPANEVVREGQVTRVTLSHGTAGEFVLRGQLLLDGRPASGFQATLHREGPRVALGDPMVTLDPEGRFELAESTGGRFDLLVQSQETFGVLTEVELTGAVTEWSLDLALAAVDVEGLPVREGQPGAVYVWEGQGVLVGAMLVPDSAGVARGVAVPAGRGRLVPFDITSTKETLRTARSLAEADAPAGETTLVRLP